jgi:hypothetical protein
MMRTFSVVFHPLLMATYALLIFYLYLPEIFSPVALRSIPTVILATFLTTCIIPVISILILKMTSRVTSLELSNREERILPFFTITLFYGAATYMYFTKLHLNPPLTSMMVVVTALIAILLLITLKFKVSIHAAAAWGTVGLLVALGLKVMGDKLIIPITVFMIISGAVSTSRLWLGSHRPVEIWVGSLIGFGFCFAGVYLFG